MRDKIIHKIGYFKKSVFFIEYFLLSININNFDIINNRV